MSSTSRAMRASIVIPTRARLPYLEVALASIAPQAARAEAEVVVIDDHTPSEAARSLAARFGARYEPHPGPLGLNVARNTGVQRSSGDLVVFVDDDVEVHDGWLAALLVAAEQHRDVDVFTGPIVARLEGRPPRTCGREQPPITSLDLGPHDLPTRFAWGANMAIRRSALERVGPFDTTIENGGDEQQWQERFRAQGGSVLYVAGARLSHRRSAEDSRLRALCAGAFIRGRAVRRFDASRGEAPALRRELSTLVGCAGHVLVRRCPAGLVMVAHSLGRTWQAIADMSGDGNDARQNEPTTPPIHLDDFLSGESGTVGGIDRMRRTAFDVASDALNVASGRRLRLNRAARREPPTRNVLVIGIERPEHRGLSEAVHAELSGSRHRVELRFAPPGERGKFENLNSLLAEQDPHGHDWLIVVDDDISLPRGFLDRFLFLAERFDLDLAQPAHHLGSHAAWRVTRRHPASVVRETRFVEIGPLTAFARSTHATLLPFPQLRMGWGLDLHWGALAREQGWRCGVIDALPIRHTSAPAASAYRRDDAIAEARKFLERHPYIKTVEAQQTLKTHRRW